MAFADPPQVICTPYIGRTIKGWSVKIRICLRVTEAEFANSTYASDLLVTQNDFLGQVNALSDATFVQTGYLVQDVVYGASGSFDDAEDSAVFAYQTVNGGLAKISIPAPKSSIFLADNQTIDPANASVLAFNTSLVGGVNGFFGATKSGGVMNLFIAGLRVRRPTRRKLNIFVKNPQLSTPGI